MGRRYYSAAPYSGFGSMNERSLGIPVIFEEHGLNSIYPESEFLITIFGAQAQAESESTSSRVRWGVQQSMRDGRASIQRSWPLQREIRPQRSAVLRRVRHGLPPRGVDTARREAHRVALLQPSGLRKEYCEHSPTLDEAPLQQAILNAVNADDAETSKQRRTR